MTQTPFRVGQKVEHLQPDGTKVIGIIHRVTLWYSVIVEVGTGRMYLFGNSDLEESQGGLL